MAASGGVGAVRWSSTSLGNYVESSPASSWLGGGTAQGWHADDESWSLSLPWSFPYYGHSYSSVWVCSNGFLDFSSSSPAYANSDAALEASVRIAPLWEDLTTTPAGDDVFVTSNANYVAVRWAANTVSGLDPVNVEAGPTQRRRPIRLRFDGCGNFRRRSAFRRATTDITPFPASTPPPASPLT